MKNNKDQIRILARDLPTGSMNLFKAIIECAPNWSGSPPTYDVFPSKGSTITKDKGYLTDLKKRSIVTTQVEQEKGMEEISWIYLTDLGKDLEAYLEERANPTPVVVDGLKEHIETTTKVGKGKPAAQPAAKVTKTTKPAAKPAKFDRAATRYAAIQECMVAVKADTWKKSSYKPMLKQMQTNYPLLFAKLKTPEKILAYSVGIVDFCLAACRKLDKKP